MSAFAGEASAACNPGPDEVALYQFKNFGGICSTLPIGDYANSKKLAMPNDSVSSIRLGGNVQITACKHAITNQVTGGLGWFDDPQSCQTFKNSNKDLKRTRLGDNTISSVSIKAKGESSFLDPGGACNPGKREVAIYQFKNLKGNCRILGVGSYPSSKQMNFKNDSVSSVQLAQGSEVYINICQHKNFGGRCEQLRSTDIDLSDNQIGDNKATSAMVKRR